MIEFKGSHFEREVILWGVRWYVAYPMSYRQLEEMMGERGVEVDHSTLNRWVVKYAPLLDQQFRARKGSGAKFRKRPNEALRPGIGSGGENCIPDFGRGFAFDEKLAEFELIFPDPMYEFDTGDGD